MYRGGKNMENIFMILSYSEKKIEEDNLNGTEC